MNLAREISALSEAYWQGRISARLYYKLCDLLIAEWRAYRDAA